MFCVCRAYMNEIQPFKNYKICQEIWTSESQFLKRSHCVVCLSSNVFLCGEILNSYWMKFL